MKQKKVFSEATGNSKLVRGRGTGLGPFSVVIIVILTFFLSQIFAGALVAYGAALFGYTPKSALDAIDNTTGLQFAYIFIAEAITLLIVWRFLKYRNVSFRAIGLGRKPSFNDVPVSLIVFGIYFVVLIMVTAILTKAVPGLDTQQEQQIGFKDAISPLQLGLVFVSLVILPPVTEEILVRGFMYTGLRAKFTKITAAIIASVIFGIAHLQLGSGAPPLWIAAIDTALLSLFLIYLREKTGALWAGMLVHGLKNGLAFMVLFIVK